MNKWFFCLIAILLCLTCAASCGKGSETPTETESETKESSTETELFIPPVIKVLDATAADGRPKRSSSTSRSSPSATTNTRSKN